jgi:hypothetical protein
MIKTVFDRCFRRRARPTVEVEADGIGVPRHGIADEYENSLHPTKTETP